MARGENVEIGEALREIERIEHELRDKDGTQDLGEDLTDARAALVEALIEQSFQQ